MWFWNCRCQISGNHQTCHLNLIRVARHSIFKKTQSGKSMRFFDECLKDICFVLMSLTFGLSAVRNYAKCIWSIIDSYISLGNLIWLSDNCAGAYNSYMLFYLILQDVIGTMKWKFKRSLQPTNRRSTLVVVVLYAMPCIVIKAYSSTHMENQTDLTISFMSD